MLFRSATAAGFEERRRRLTGGKAGDEGQGGKRDMTEAAGTAPDVRAPAAGGGWGRKETSEATGAAAEPAKTDMTGASGTVPDEPATTAAGTEGKAETTVVTEVPRFARFSCGIRFNEEGMGWGGRAAAVAVARDGIGLLHAHAHAFKDAAAAAAAAAARAAAASPSAASCEPPAIAPTAGARVEFLPRDERDMRRATR